MRSLLKDAKQCIHVPDNEVVNRRLPKLQISALGAKAYFTREC